MVTFSNRSGILAAVAIGVLWFAGAADLKAQDTTPAPTTRAEQIQEEEAAKAQSLAPDLPGRDEKRFADAEKDAHHILQGENLRLQIGGLPMPSGFALGPTLQWQSTDDHERASIWGIGSVHLFYNTGLGFELPRLTGQKIDVKFEAAHLDLPQLDFYGEGPTSQKSQRTDYRREDTRFDTSFEWPVMPHLTPDCKVEQHLINVGPGTNDDVTSTELKFTPAEAPGVNIQSNYLVTGCGIRLDYRDAPDYPRKGPSVMVGYRYFGAEQDNHYSFNEVSGTAEEYIPFFNRKRVIALHAATNLTFHNENQVIPFYLQPTLGGFNDLRGYRPLRFYDENSLVTNAEYRWEICTGFDMALFEDVGEVFHRPELFQFSELQNSTGFGIRINNAGSSVMRIDTGFSREGFQVWAAFSKVF